MDFKAVTKQAVSLDKMLVPVILLWIYRIGLGIIGLCVLASGFMAFGENILKGILIILIGLPLALIIWRIWVELIYIGFGIYKELNEINHNTKR